MKLLGGEPVVTVFTATYNRAYILGDLYQSLKEQTNHDFEWLIIDDGSTDHTKELVDQWRKETTEFQILYRPVAHGGKCRAINRAALWANSEAVFFVDSDDRLTPDAIEFVKAHFPEISDDTSFAGMCVFIQSYADGRIITGNISSDHVDATRWEREQYGLTGDAGLIFKTSVLKEFPSPEFEGEDYLSPGVFLNDLTHKGLKFRWFNHVAYLAEYLKDGITKNSWERYKGSPHGCAYYISQQSAYGLISTDQFRRQVFYLYERSKSAPFDFEMHSAFQMNSTDMNEIIALYDAAKQEISETLQRNEVKTLALYGYGWNAKRLMCYLTELGVEVSYIIDREYQTKDFRPAYSLKMDLPAVDSVCVTLDSHHQEVITELKRKLPDAHIWQLADAKIRIWQSDNHIFMGSEGAQEI